MDENGKTDQLEGVMLPGFRFHPTDEELIGFYLKRKVEQKPLAIQLIRQLDIYKYDPWDLPKLAMTGEKEWYFYCPRDRKYRNSPRPNRVTGAGFWKATGTDRPIYSSDGTLCIGLKKSLVFYRGRAAKGIKTDWMMHEFRLPALCNSSPTNRPLNMKNIPAGDQWAICRIFKKTRSVARKTLPQSLPSSLPKIDYANQFAYEDSACMNQFGSNNGLQLQQQQRNITYHLDATSHETSKNSYKHSLPPILSEEIPASFLFSPAELSVQTKSLLDVASMFHNISPTMFTGAEKASSNIDFGQPKNCDGGTDLPLGVVQHFGSGGEEISMKVITNTSISGNDHLETMHAIGFPLGLLPKPSDEEKTILQWVSSLCPNEITSYSINE